MRNRATVEAVRENGTALLAVRRESACSGDCHHCVGCGAAEQTVHLTARNPIGAQCGDVVWVASESVPVLKAAALLYLLPPLLFVAAYLAGDCMGTSAALTGAAGFAVGLLPAFAWNRRLRHYPAEHRIVGFVK